MNVRFLLREMYHSRKQAMVFMLCVALSLLSIVAVNSFRRDIRGAIASDARVLHGGDIIVHSRGEFSLAMRQELAVLRSEKGVVGVSTWEFYSVARSVNGADNLFCNIKAVEDGYPLYGRVELRSGRGLAEVLQPGKVIVGAAVLDRLGLALGDRLLLGNASLEIVDVVTRESLRPVEFFNFGPRILVAAVDLERIDLVKGGSRVSYEMLLAIDDKTRLSSLVSRLEQLAGPGQERVATSATASSRVKRFFDNLLFFLSLISVFTLFLAGIGMQSSLAALLRRKVKSMAIIRSLGATGWFLMRHYLALVLLLSIIGFGLGIGAGLLVKQSFATLLVGLLPDNIVLGASLIDVVEGVGLGLAVVSFFTFLPLSTIEGVKPAAIFRKEIRSGEKRTTPRVMIGVGLLILAALVVRQLDDVRTGLYFMGGVLALVVVIGALSTLLLRFLSRMPMRILSFRQATRSLLRPGNATRSVIVTLASALAVLLAIFLVKENLRATYIDSYPAHAPNLFCLDIQKDQRQGFIQLVGENVELFPVVRARLQAINGRKVDREKESEKRGDSLAREFSLTYRQELLHDETLVAGDALFGTKERVGTVVPVSLLDTVAEIGDMKIGDVLDFNIQGLPLQAEVTSIRSRTKSKLYPFFYFLFPEPVLRDAPQTFFGALQVDKVKLSSLENRIVNSFPNISTINVTETAAELGKLMEKLTVVVTFFAAFAILAGGLILISSILATRMARMEEAVYYKILGAGPPFVLRVFLLENVLLALLSCVCAVFVGQMGSWALCRWVFDIVYSPYWLICLFMVGATVGLVVVLGLASSIAIIRKKPVKFLREQS